MLKKPGIALLLIILFLQFARGNARQAPAAHIQQQHINKDTLVVILSQKDAFCAKNDWYLLSKFVFKNQIAAKC
jgi:hypothetical protein